MAMGAVRAKDVVIISKMGKNASSYGLLTGVKMARCADFAFIYGFYQAFFAFPNAAHGKQKAGKELFVIPHADILLI